MRKYYKNIKPVLFVICLFFLMSCNNTDIKYVDYDIISTFSENNKVQAVIEIPAGTGHKYEYNHDTKEFEVEIIKGKERVVDFLPYVANYGFIPSTYMNPEIGGDGDPLDILVISESVKMGTIQEVEPIAIMKMIDDREMDYKILAVPIDESKAIIKAKSFKELQDNYPNVILIIETWFLSYKHNDSVYIEAWGDEKMAMEEIKKWLTQK